MSLKSTLKSFISRSLFWQQDKKKVYVFIDANRLSEYPDHMERCKFYLVDAFKVVTYSNKFQFYTYLLIYGPYRALMSTEGISSKVINAFFFSVDYHTNPQDGWAWHELLIRLYPLSPEDLEKSKKRLKDGIASIPKFDASIIFGTGPSLSRAYQLTEAETYKVVCNTIVKDLELWMKLKPHFIVAGDAIYHFGFNMYSRSFRSDLVKCLLRYEALFIFPALYYPFLRRELKEIEHLMVPIPAGNTMEINNKLTEKFELPALGNVLNLLLLPLATTLSKKVYMIGFDGRAPKDKLFWANSNQHSYQEHIPDIQKNHPKFFEYFIDSSNPFKYVQAVHGDTLDNNLSEMEKDGYEFYSLMPSFTPTMQKRYKDIFNLPELGS